MSGDLAEADSAGSPAAAESAGRPAPRLLRDRSGLQRVTNIELFFDLVYVFAVTQLGVERRHRHLQPAAARGHRRAEQ